MPPSATPRPTAKRTTRQTTRQAAKRTTGQPIERTTRQAVKRAAGQTIEPTTPNLAASPQAEDFEARYRVLGSRDHRFDGCFFVAVTSTGIYCRPSCPAIVPKRRNVRFYPTAAAAQSAGFRACLRCHPHAAPGSPEWNRRGDLAARAMGLIADGVVDREGVHGLARRLAYSERHLTRQLAAELGAGPLALARAQRAQTARILIETTSLRLIDVAHAAGFASVRQFNDTIREVYARTPTALRRKAHPPPADGSRGASVGGPGAGGLPIVLRLAYREPLDWGRLVGFLGARAVPGVEEVVDGCYRRTLRLPHGHGVVALAPVDGAIACRLRLADLRDLTAAVQRCRRLLDLDADPTAPAEHLAGDPLLAPLVRAAPGLRLPGAVDGAELAARAVLGQQISVPAARTAAARLTQALGEPLPAPDGSLTHLFPTPAAIAAAAPGELPGGPARRRHTLQALARLLADGELAIDPGSDRAELRARLLALPGVGPWTAEYIAMRALADPDAFLPTDLGVRHALEALGRGDPAASGRCSPRDAARVAERWRPWRAYALQHLWGTLAPA
ncbi:MAG TPA: AlkA N-terminal domain-containing protein [Solirubrobacteraceae bacterium]|jgi:AraC family transcriptional regulator of adaptative response / DNA-3-methyladenine glycosylase II|nr:AlkA N-terminal domain-containing protein [Solirubrobacteraceae bacterium]